MPPVNPEFTYKAVVSYDGSDFHGMTTQPSLRTVASVLNEAISAAFKFAATVKHAGRTDAGVHATGQVISFQLPYDLKPRQVIHAINGRLPADVRLTSVSKVRSEFDPRHDAKGKVYRYTINTGKFDPLQSRFVWQLNRELDAKAMRSACRLLIGTHDFLSFSSETRDNTVRTLDKVTVNKRGSLITLTFEGRAFLRYMVRMLVGSLVEIGTHQIEEKRLEKFLKTPVKGSASRKAPPNGLTLLKVKY